MKTATTIWIIAAAVVACGAIAVGIYFNQSDQLPRVAATPPADDFAVLETSQPTDATSDVPQGVTLESPQVASTETLEVETTSVIDPVALERGRLAFVAGDYEKCIQELAPTAEAGDRRFDVHYLLGLACRYTGKIEESQAAFADALDIAPDNVRALVNSARSLLELGRVAEANTSVLRALEIAPEDSDGWNVLGRTQLADHQQEAAIEAFQRAVELNPENAYAMNNLGLAYIQLGRWQEAVETLEAAIACRPDVAYFHNNLGVSHEQLGDLRAAAQSYAEAVRLQPDHAKAQLSLARVTALVPAEPEVTEVAGTEVPTP